MKGFYLGSNEKKDSGKEIHNTDARFAERKYKISSMKIKHSC